MLFRSPESLAAKDESNLLIEAARPLEDFVGELFGISGDVANLRGRDSKFAPLYDCKRLFVQRYVTRAIKPDAVGAEPAVDVGANLADGVEAWELAFAVKVRGLVGAEFKVDKPTPEIEAHDHGLFLRIAASGRGGLHDRNHFTSTRRVPPFSRTTCFDKHLPLSI